jgi:hypothetical protein
MFTGTSGIMKLVLSVVFFPMFFQEMLLQYAWGVGDVTLMMVSKRIFVLVPAIAFIIGCWVTIAALLTVLIRQNRRQFITALFVTWWDMGKAIVFYWGGIFKFVFTLIGTILGIMKLFIFTLAGIIYEIFLFPVKILHGLGRSIVRSSTPWIAVILTLFWCLIEGVIFTYVTTPIVVDTFSNITGEQISENFIRIPLFIFLLFIVLGSYAVLATFADVIRKKNVSAIIGIGVIEIIALSVEVVFLYREFVDSLVPWFAQYSENFELGIFWTLAISCFAWFGIRSLSWFLFAEHGTPTIMRVIQGKGLADANQKTPSEVLSYRFAPEFLTRIKKENKWFQDKGEELLDSFMLPLLQVIASIINFFTLLVSANHLFELPFKKIGDIKNSKALIGTVKV